MSAAMSITIPLNQVYNEILACAQAEEGPLTPLFTSSPGVGKSSAVQAFARDYNLKLIDIRLSQATPEDLNGYPMRSGNKATFTPFDIFPLDSDEIPAGYQGWLLFLDELTSAPKAVQVAAYKLILDRMVGSYHLHPSVMIVSAGNKLTDKAVVNQLSTALQSRLVHFEVEIKARDFLDYAIRKGLDHRVTSFIEYMPSKLMDFNPDHQDKTFACPRTWEFLSRLLKGKDIDDKATARICGTVGTGCGVEFMTFAKEFDRIPKFRDVVASPKDTDVPKEASTKYATVSMLAENLDTKTVADVLTYIARFPIEFQVIFLRNTTARHPGLREKNKTFEEYVLGLARYVG